MPAISAPIAIHEDTAPMNSIDRYILAILLLFQYPSHRHPADVLRMIPGERCHSIDIPVIVDPDRIPSMDDPSVPEADAAVAPVDRTFRALKDAIIEDKRASLRYVLAHSVSIEQILPS